MDAYVFASQASQQAVSSLLSSVGTTARVVCPLQGHRAVYVAVSGSDQQELDDNVAAVVGTQGLTGAGVYAAAEGVIQGTFPTHAAVNDKIGFAVLDVVSGSAASAAELADGVSGVIGVAVVTGSPAKLVVEVTASTAAGVASILGAVTALSGVAEVFTATGSTGDGAGFTA